MEYPYYIYPDILELKNGNPDAERRMFLKRRIAANVGDEDALARLFGIDPEEFAEFYPDMSSPAPSTFDTIDSFLTKFGHAPERTPAPSPLAETIAPPEPPTLKDLIKNHQYEEAIKFISDKNLNNPEKNIYFADQIRFLRKLIVNESRKKC